jgi:D-alanyl-D-alanine-carboxypeptidase/D-alanyl-D-alanine-endopeptidase
VFTSLLLSDMVQRGEVVLTDPIAKYLPAGVKVPERGGKQITLQDLATHTSGLPRMPNNFAPRDSGNPYADYTVAQLYEFLASYKLPRDIGSHYEYSNVGAGLLGHVLALRAGMDYEALVRTRICEPLAMKSTGITLSRELKERLATGHDTFLNPVPNWDIPTLAGAGGLRSDANDLLNFVAAILGYTKSPLATAMAGMLKVRHSTTIPRTEIALGWHVTTRDGMEIVWHNGGTGGYSSFIGYDEKARIGVVVLSNLHTQAGLNDLGMHLLDAQVLLIGPVALHREIAVDPKRYDGYVGRYQLAPGSVLTITRDGNDLMAQVQGQGKLRIFPEGPSDYFYKAVDAQITFETDASEHAAALVLHQGGQNMRAKRIEGDVLPAAEHKEVAIGPKFYDVYVGQYQLTPLLIFTITREGNQLFAQLTGQPSLQIFPEGPREYFYKAVEAQISFETDAQGHAVALVLHQNGRDMRAKRIE